MQCAEWRKSHFTRPFAASFEVTDGKERCNHKEYNQRMQMWNGSISSHFILQRLVWQNDFTWTHQAWTNFFHSLSPLYPTSAFRLYSYNVPLIAKPLETVRHMKDTVISTGDRLTTCCHVYRSAHQFYCGCWTCWHQALCQQVKRMRQMRGSCIGDSVECGLVHKMWRRVVWYVVIIFRILSIPKVVAEYLHPKRP
jgi:hypothetical protein